MDIESFTPSDVSPEGGGNGAEKTNETTEKQRESAKKAQAGVQRTQKDESKAKKHDFMLAKFLVAILLNKKYDFLHSEMFALLDDGYPSNFVLGIVSLLYTPMSHDIRSISEKAMYVFQYSPSQEVQDFNDGAIDENLKKRINYWIEDIIDVTTIGASSTLTTRLISLLNQDDRVIQLLIKVFSFFLSENNLTISENKAKSYSLFIIGEVQKALKNVVLEEV